MWCCWSCGRMNKVEWASAIDKGRLLRKRDWFGDALGLVHVAGLWVIMSFLLFWDADMLGRKLAWLGFASTLPLYAIHCLRRENDLTLVVTDLPAAENRKLVLFAFKTLGWEIHSNTKDFIISGANNKWWSNHGQTATALIADDKVYLNVIHGGTSRGRLPFYFGSNRRKLQRAIAAIKSAQLSSGNQIV